MTHVVNTLPFDHTNPRVLEAIGLTSLNRLELGPFEGNASNIIEQMEEQILSDPEKLRATVLQFFLFALDDTQRKAIGVEYDNLSKLVNKENMN